MKRILFAVLMMTCSVSWAEWEYMGTTNDREANVYVDKSTIRRNAIIAKMWTLHYLSTIKVGHAGEKIKSTKLLRAFNCREETEAAILIAEYSGSIGSGSVIASGSLEAELWKWNPIVPHSIGETQWLIACGKR